MKSIILSLAIISSSLATAHNAPNMTIEELKEEITKIAAANTDRLDNLSQIRAQLEPLVQQLKMRGDQTIEERITGKYGSWRQLWTDDSDDTRPNTSLTTIDRSRTFQIVDPAGFFYNVSEIKTKLKVRVTAFLRGVYELEGDGVKIKFTNLDIKALGTKRITETVYKLESKTEKFFPATRFSKYPRGPVGAEGFIDTVYVDEDIRIDYGYNSVDKILDLFVLKRMPEEMK